MFKFLYLVYNFDLNADVEAIIDDLILLMYVVRIWLFILNMD